MEKTRVDLLLRCDCGYLKVLSTMLKQVEITKVDTPSEAKLPRPNTKLWHTIKVLGVMTEANSAKITERLVDLGEEVNVSDVSSYLTILRSKGLVITKGSRRGLTGGSTWTLSDVCIRLLGVK